MGVIRDRKRALPLPLKVRHSRLSVISETIEDRYFLASHWQLTWHKFRCHRLAIFGALTLFLFYFAGIMAGFLSPNDPHSRYVELRSHPPMKLNFVDSHGKFHLRPFVYRIETTQDHETWEPIFVEDVSIRYPLQFFVRSWEYQFWGLFNSRWHLLGVDQPGVLMLLGSDSLGRDLFSRNLFATRLSLSIGLMGVAISFMIGCMLGGVAGFYGGSIDTIVQRLTEFIMVIPKIPLWLALAAALPANWPMVRIYFSVTILLSLVTWPTLSRVLRGRLLQLKNEDFTMAAKISGATDGKIIVRHLFPNVVSYLIVNVTLSIPEMIIGETALSFLGIGLRDPAISWGVLLHDAQNIRTISLHPWLLIPAIFVIITVLSFNFLGDGLRDSTDPFT